MDNLPDGAWSDPAANYVEGLQREIADLEQRLAAVTAERNALQRLFDAKLPLHERRKYPTAFSGEADPDTTLRTLGFWPDCECVECRAIDRLDHWMGRAESAESALAEARKDAERWRGYVAHAMECAATNYDGEPVSHHDYWITGSTKVVRANGHSLTKADFDTAIDAAIAKGTEP